MKKTKEKEVDISQVPILQRLGEAIGVPDSVWRIIKVEAPKTNIEHGKETQADK